MMNIVFELGLIAFLVCVGFYYKPLKNQNEFLAIQSTTVMRGVAIIMVYLQHTMGALGTNLFTPLGGGGVCVFLILSGYGLSESFRTKGLIDFWKKRFVGVLLAWWIVFTLSLVVEGNYTNIGFVTWFSEFTLINTVCWYLQYLFVWYVLFYICHYFSFLNRCKWFVYIIAAITMFLFWHNIQAEQSLAFISGMLLSEKKDFFSKMNTRQQKFLLLSSLILACCSLGLKQLPFIRECGEQSLIMKFCQFGLKTGIGWFVIMCRPKYNLFLHFTGKISYEIYLIHVFLIPEIFKILDMEKNMVYIVLFLSTTYMFSYILHRLNILVKRIL